MQSIKEIFDKIKAKEKIITENTTIFTMLIIILIAFSSFGLGRLSIIEESKVPISVRNNQNSNLATISETTIGDSSKSVGIVSPQIFT